jgi:cyanobactin maturation PatA/PatG family protease
VNPVSDIPGLRTLWQDAAGGDPEIRIAIIDGPVDLGHPSLHGARLTFGGSTQGATASSVRSEHGTHVASVLMAQPGGPVLGIAPNATARLYSIYQEGEDGELLPSSQADLALAIRQAVRDGAHLINISSGQITPTGQAERILADAVRRCAEHGNSEHGTLIVAAAGNDGCRCLHVPAALDPVLAVGACDPDGQPLPFSNYGDSYAVNGILAPGQGIVGASPRAGVAMRSGTSFATPVVTGVAALLLSRLHQSGRDVDPQAVRSALLAGASPCPAEEQQPGGRCLAGRLDVPGATAILFPSHPDRDAPQAAVLSASGTARGPARLERFEQRGSGHSTPPQTIRESTMSDTSNGGAVQTSQLLGPDGNPLATAVAPAAAGQGVGPEASAEPSVQAVAPAASAPPLQTGSPQAQAVGLHAPQMAGAATAAETPAAGAVTPAHLPAHGPAMASPAPPSPPQGPAAPEVQPSGAGCGCPGVVPAQAEDVGEQVFVIGKLYYDFGTEARLDYFIQAIASWRDGLGGRGSDPSFGPDRNKSGDQASPYNPEIMVRYLLNLAPGEDASPGGDTNFPDANAIIWTETIDATPIYAIKPSSAFAWAVYATLVNTLWLQEVAHTLPNETKGYVSAESVEGGAPEPDAFPPKGGVTRVSQAGNIVDSTRLLNGTVVPALQPVWRGLYSWNLYDLLGPNPEEWPAGVQGFLERIYNEFRNVGISPQDRALNYSAMNAYNTKRIFAGMATDQMRLDTVAVDRSTICRPDSDCWDVTYRFFDPTQVLTTARKVWQYTIDVSDVVPVPVGVLRTWEVY